MWRNFNLEQRRSAVDEKLPTLSGSFTDGKNWFILLDTVTYSTLTAEKTEGIWKTDEGGEDGEVEGHKTAR